MFAVAGVAGLVLLVTSGRYGYWGDELYYLAAGRHPDRGYADQPPLVPLLASAMDPLFAGSLVGFRLPALLMTVAGWSSPRSPPASRPAATAPSS